MKYYKILENDTFLAIATSDNFMAGNDDGTWFLRTDELHGQFLEVNAQCYHDYWMQPTPLNMTNVILANVIRISEEEYQILYEAIQNNIPVVEPEPEPEQPEEPSTPEDNVITPDVTLEFVRSSKINEMSRTCNQVIEAGFDLQLSDGNTHHFSLTTQDQINLISLGSMAANGMEAIPYHADGEICRFYTAEEITTILAQATAFKIYHTTYYNALKNYINSLDTIEAIAAVTYGIELPEEYQSEVLKSLQQ